MHPYSKRQNYILPTKVVHAGALGLILSILLNAFGTVFYIASMKSLDSSYFLSDNTPARLPLNPRTVALKVIDAEESDRYGLHDDNDWASVTPLGKGFVKIGDRDGVEDYYAISMYHQFHCLNDFRKMLSGRQRNESRAEHDKMHVVHCLAYLRQMILCNADTTLEPAFSALNTDGRKTKAAYGAGVIHQCRDWEQIREFSEVNFQSWKDETTGFASSEADVIN